MRTSDREEFGQLVTDVMAYYGKDASIFTLDLWWSACSNFDLGQVRKAMTAHATDPERGVYPPKVADLVRVLSGTVTDRAALAWGKALDAAGRVGAYSDVVFDDPAIHATIEDLGGWPKFCRTETAQISYLQHRFCESYKAYSGREKFDYPRRLAGDRSPDDVYEKRGLPAPKPTVIGDLERARQVYRHGALAGKTSFARLAFDALENKKTLVSSKQTGTQDQE